MAEPTVDMPNMRPKAAPTEKLPGDFNPAAADPAQPVAAPAGNITSAPYRAVIQRASGGAKPRSGNPLPGADADMDDAEQAFFDTGPRLDKPRKTPEEEALEREQARQMLFDYKKYISDLDKPRIKKNGDLEYLDANGKPVTYALFPTASGDAVEFFGSVGRQKFTMETAHAAAAGMREQGWDSLDIVEKKGTKPPGSHRTMMFNAVMLQNLEALEADPNAHFLKIGNLNTVPLAARHEFEQYLQELKHEKPELVALFEAARNGEPRPGAASPRQEPVRQQPSREKETPPAPSGRKTPENHDREIMEALKAMGKTPGEQDPPSSRKKHDVQVMQQPGSGDARTGGGHGPIVPQPVIGVGAAPDSSAIAKRAPDDLKPRTVIDAEFVEPQRTDARRHVEGRVFTAEFEAVTPPSRQMPEKNNDVMTKSGFFALPEAKTPELPPGPAPTRLSPGQPPPRALPPKP